MLERRKYQVLTSIDQENNAVIKDQAVAMEEKHIVIDDIKEQRQFLISKIISAQRLALDRCNFSYKFAKEKAWARFVKNTLGGMRAQYGEATATNLDHIDKLK